MEKYGVFICHRHLDWAIAGRIFDYLQVRGYNPFLDASSLHQGNYHEALEKRIAEAPYFLCLLTKNTFRKIDPEDWLYREIKTALEYQREILLLAEKGFKFPDDLPVEIEAVKKQHCYEFDRTDFLEKMERLCKNDLKKETLNGILDWRKNLFSNHNVCMFDRKHIEHSLATLDDRFGKDLVDSVRFGKEFTGVQRVRSVHMSCYAASILFSNSADMVDDQAFDRGMMFNIFAQLLKDEEFSLEIVINAPNCLSVKDAIENKKLGNSALEAYPEAIFLSSYCNIQRLISEDPIFKKAYQTKRFRFMVTEAVLPYALFHTTYKDEFSSYDHIKVDLYSENLLSNMERRCMIIFKEDDLENYSFFTQRYKSVRNVKKSKELIHAHHDEWVAQWDELREEMMQ